MTDTRFATGLVALVAAASVAAAAAMVAMELESAGRHRPDVSGAPAANPERRDESADGRRGAHMALAPSMVALAAAPIATAP